MKSHSGRVQCCDNKEFQAQQQKYRYIYIQGTNFTKYFYDICVCRTRWTNTFWKSFLINSNSFSQTLASFAINENHFNLSCIKKCQGLWRKKTLKNDILKKQFFRFISSIDCRRQRRYSEDIRETPCTKYEIMQKKIKAIGDSIQINFIARERERE